MNLVDVSEIFLLGFLSVWGSVGEKGGGARGEEGGVRSVFIEHAWEGSSYPMGCAASGTVTGPGGEGVWGGFG